MRFQPFVDRMLADSFGLSIEELHRPGIHVVEDAPGFLDPPRVYVLRLGESVIAAVPTAPVPHLSRAFGPSWHGYLHRDDFAPGPAAGRRVEPTDHDAIRAFQSVVGDDAFAEGGFHWDSFPEVAWLVEDDDGIAALGNMTDFAGMPADVGLATRPDVRGRGLATRLATAMLVECFQSYEVARYRALTTNTASLAVAARLGFSGYGENIVIRFGD